MRSHSQTYLERLHGRRGELKIGHQVSHLLLLLHECPLQDSVHGVGSCGRRAQCTTSRRAAPVVRRGDEWTPPSRAYSAIASSKARSR